MKKLLAGLLLVLSSTSALADTGTNVFVANTINTTIGTEFMSVNNTTSWSCSVNCTYDIDLPYVSGSATAQNAEIAFNNAKKKCLKAAEVAYPDVHSRSIAIFIFGEVENGKPTPARIITDCVKN